MCDLTKIARGQHPKPGLKGLASDFGEDINKPKKWQTSNWARRPLLPQQIQYAAQDAWVGLWLARCLYHEGHRNRSLRLEEWLALEAQERRTAGSL